MASNPLLPRLWCKRDDIGLRALQNKVMWA
jgi:hypothetical protein